MDAEPESARPARPVANVILVAGFLAAISAPGLVQFLGLSLGSLAENRNRAPRPELEFRRAALAEFPEKFDAYYRDSFGLRDQLIGWNKYAKVCWLGTSPSPNVLIGRGGWLFYTGEGSLDDMRHARPFTLEELEVWRRTYESRRDWLAQRNIRYLIVIPPNKHTIYPEFVPARLAPMHAQSRYGQLLKYLRTHTDLPILDLRQPLLAEKASGRLYFRRDTHWNQRGAMVAYRAIGAELGRWFSNVRPQPPAAFHESYADCMTPDLSLLLGLGGVLPDRAEVLYEPVAGRKARRVPVAPEFEPDPAVGRPLMGCAFERAEPGLPRAMMFGDSFSLTLMPFLSEYFSRSFYKLLTPFDSALIEREQPQIVIDEAVERKLWGHIPPAGVPEPMIARK